MWLFVPNTSTSSPSAQAEPVSISVSSWQFRALEASAWSRGKPSRRRNWYQRWKRDIWLQRLCGAMPEPSTADAGVDAWTASLAASRASRTVSPESGSSAKTLATSGRPPAASSSSLARGSSSSRTSAACSPAAAPSGFGETFTDWALRVREDCSRRRKSVRATKENGSSSLQWRTPASNNGERGGMTPEEREEHTLNLQDQVQGFKVSAWPTPTANDWKGSGPTLERSDGKMRGDRLDYATEQLWRTPRASDGEKGGPNQAFGAGGIPLAAQSVQWTTPCADDTSTRTKRFAQGGTPLSMQASFHQAHPTYQVGQVSSHPRRSLNPLFVEWLMGWPPGWTLLAWTDLGCSATALSLWRQRMRSALSQLALPSAAPPAQLALFG